MSPNVNLTLIYFHFSPPPSPPHVSQVESTEITVVNQTDDNEESADPLIRA